MLAAQKLKDDVVDANKFQKEMKSGRVRGAWEKDLKGNGKAKAGSPAGVKRRASVASSLKEIEDVEAEADKRGKKRKVDESTKDADPKGKKKARFTENDISQESKGSDVGPPGKGIKFMTTGLNLDDKTIEVSPLSVFVSSFVTYLLDLQQGLKQLGMKQTEKPKECTHLLVRAIMRTEKFLLALANGPYIITKDWALQCVRDRQVLCKFFNLIYFNGGSWRGFKHRTSTFCTIPMAKQNTAWSCWKR